MGLEMGGRGRRSVSRKRMWAFAEVEVVECCSVKLERALVQSRGVRSSLKAKGGGAGVAGGCTGEMATSLRCVVLESSRDVEP